MWSVLMGWFVAMCSPYSLSVLLDESCSSSAHTTQVMHTRNPARDSVGWRGLLQVLQLLVVMSSPYQAVTLVDESCRFSDS